MVGLFCSLNIVIASSYLVGEPPVVKQMREILLVAKNRQITASSRC